MLRSPWISAVAIVALAATANASIEEFDTWDLGAEELDDEYGMDLYTMTFSAAWERDWRAARDGARLSMGCVTRERWDMLLEAGIERQLGSMARFTYRFIQEQRLSLDNMQHAFGFEVAARAVWLGGFARPSTAKERHDFGLTARRSWDSGYHVDFALSFEDPLNNFWTERSFIEERYRVEFLDPAREWRFGGGRRWSPRRQWRTGVVLLPEFRRRVEPPPSSGAPESGRLLDGSFLFASGEVDPGERMDLDLLLSRKQSRLADRIAPAGSDPGTDSDIRRLAWTARGRFTHPLYGRWLLAWGLQVRRNREQDVGPTAPYRMVVRELLGSGGIRRPLASWVDVEVGYTHMDVRVDQSGDESALPFTYGSRNEQRLYIAGGFAWRGVRVQLVESLEVDGESYDTVGVHDKGFIQIQGAF